MPEILQSVVAFPSYNQVFFSNFLFLKYITPLTAKVSDWNFHSLEVVPRWRDPQLQVSEN